MITLLQRLFLISLCFLFIKCVCNQTETIRNLTSSEIKTHEVEEDGISEATIIQDYNLIYFIPQSIEFDFLTRDSLSTYVSVSENLLDNIGIQINFKSINIIRIDSALLVSQSKFCDLKINEVKDIFENHQDKDILRIIVGYDNAAYSAPTTLPDPLFIYLPQMYLSDAKVFVHEVLHFHRIRNETYQTIDQDHVESDTILNHKINTKCFQRNLMNTSTRVLNNFMFTVQQQHYFNFSPSLATSDYHEFPNYLSQSDTIDECVSFDLEIDQIIISDYNDLCNLVLSDDELRKLFMKCMTNIENINHSNKIILNEAELLTKGSSMSPQSYANLKQERLLKESYIDFCYLLGASYGIEYKANNSIKNKKENKLFLLKQSLKDTNRSHLLKYIHDDAFYSGFDKYSN